MKKIIFVSILMMLAAIGWSEGAAEELVPKSAPITLTWISPGNVAWAEGEDFRGYPSVNEKLAADFEKAHPGVKVTVLVRDMKQGSLTVDAMMARGTPPDVWLDASGYFNNYLNAEYAIPLEKYINTKIYQKDLIEKYTRNGHVYALPNNQVVGGLAINLDMLAEIGYTMPDQKDWTTDEFLKLGAKLKAKGIPLTMIMGKGGFNTWNNVFLYAFGAEFFKNGDYSKTTINSKEALAGFNYIKQIIDLGYAYPNPVELNDDDGVELFTTGKVFSCMMQDGHLGWIPQQIKQGKLDKEFNVTFVEVPHAANRAHTPVYGYQAIVVGHVSSDETRNKLVAELVAVAAGKELQWYGQVIGSAVSTIPGWTATIGTASGASYKALAKLAGTAGLMEELYQCPNAAKGLECGRIWQTMTEQFVRGKLSAKDLLIQFEKEANKILAGK